jgi:4-aminobutyrate aminotransferase
MAVEKTVKSKNAELLARNALYVAPTNARCFDIVTARGAGSYLWDVDGNRYLDFTCGIAVNNVGHCHPRVVEAAKAQLEQLMHTAMVTAHQPIIELSQKLTELAGGNLDTVFLNNSGGEAIDAAIKFARYVTGRPNVISFTGAFHGRTLLATALTTAKSYYREGYEPLPSGIMQVAYPYCYRCPVDREPFSCSLECFDLLDRVFQHQMKPNTVAAVIMEPVLGEGGYVVPATGYAGAEGYMQKLRQLCDKHGILLIFDEVQTGFGRTGKWFAWHNWGTEPDIMVLAKGIASGLPMAAVVSRKELFQKWHPGRHGSTYGGNPVACAAALASIATIEEDSLLENAQSMGELIRSHMLGLQTKFPCIGDVRGLGLMIGIEIIDKQGKPDGKLLSRLVQACFERKLLLLDCGSQDHIIRFVPPLNCSEDEVRESFSIFDDALASVH